jgi:ABC-2 type transport system permease protein
LRSPDTGPALRAPFRPLLTKELWQIVGGRALWTMLLLLCPLVGYSFVQAVSLYREASLAASQSPALATSLSPLDGVLVPTFGAFYVAVTLLFPFVAIRVLGQEKETGALRLLIQLPYRTSTLIAAKLGATLAAWLIAAIPALSALAVWEVLGGHLDAPETLNLLFGHLLYGLLVGAIALFAASISESAATAAIITLAFTIGSWVLDFTAAGRPGLFDWLSRLSLTQALRPFERGCCRRVSSPGCSLPWRHSRRWLRCGCPREFRPAGNSRVRWPPCSRLSWCSRFPRSCGPRSMPPQTGATRSRPPTRAPCGTCVSR